MSNPATSYAGVYIHYYIGDADWCLACGRRTERVRERITHYSQKTGKSYREVLYRCPKARFWNGHTDQWVHPLPPPPEGIEDES